MLAKNQINRNKTDNKAKADNKNIDFMPFIQNDINGHIEWEQQKQICYCYETIENTVF